jgi:hypothetical protein
MTAPSVHASLTDENKKCVLFSLTTAGLKEYVGSKNNFVSNNLE